MELLNWRPEMADETVEMLSRAFAQNPLHIAAFGPSSVLEKNRAFFRTGLPLFSGRRMVATEGSRILGFIHWVESPGCQIPLMQRLGLLPVMLRELGPLSTLRVSSWLSSWAKRDCRDTHCHLGPVGVEANFHGKGIGAQMMRMYCAELDKTAAVGYLETDSQKNVDFYRKFGFELVLESRVISVPSYYMTRQRISLEKR